MDAPEAASVEKEHEKEEGNRGKGKASEILYGDPPNSLQSPATPAPLLNSADADLTQPEVLPSTMRDTQHADGSSERDPGASGVGFESMMDS